jgi:hypothetical protein
VIVASATAHQTALLFPAINRSGQQAIAINKVEKVGLNMLYACAITVTINKQ